MVQSPWTGKTMPYNQYQSHLGEIQESRAAKSQPQGPSVPLTPEVNFDIVIPKLPETATVTL